MKNSYPIESQIKKYSRRIKRPLPDYDLPRPLQSQMGGVRSHAIVYTLFIAYEGVIPHYVINSAFWAAHSWRVNSNLHINEWDIFFLVEDRLYADPAVQAQFKKANLDRCVFTFNVPQGRCIRHKLGTKLYAATVPFFQDCERVILADTDMFLSVRDEGRKLNIRRCHNLGDDESLFMTYEYGNRLTSRRIAPQKYEFETEEEARPIYDTFVKKYLGYTQHKYWQVSGQLFAWNPQQLRSDFKDMVLELTPNICDDEEQYGLWIEKHNLQPQKLRELWGIPMYHKREDYDLTDSIYFDHIWLESTEADWERRSEWKKKAMFERESDPLIAYDDPSIANLWRDNIGLNLRGGVYE